MMSPASLAPLLRRLSAEAKRNAEARRAADAAGLSRLELRGLLLRFGADARQIDAAVAADDPLRLPEAAREHLRSRLAAEAARLARRARIRDPRYDINRHVAVSRLQRWLNGERPWSHDEEDVRSGRELNNRFRGKSPARRADAGDKMLPGNRDRAPRQRASPPTKVSWPFA
ncbi:hypothetical protein [Aurantimonas sp. VKM B-3413]|uniref:hypothetical protein n=1 Tax=Aurantimonas sp. VKM B-3413 TaxID=2779401 RepID=UPI001E4B65E7|nr:hypothetical protein [Aurantimonas sp. VKM B-3413]MCB8838854.1 hypothetical protein [Aurantimonas sp. VKM B-3413]